MSGKNITSELTGLLDLENPPAHLAVDVLSEDEFEGYTRRRIEYAGFENDVIPAYLFVPNRKVNVGVVAFHQHNGEFHLGKSEIAGLVGDPLQAFGPVLAPLGVTVLAPDAVGFEDRRAHTSGISDTENDWLQHYNSMAYRLVNGGSLMRKCLDDARRALTVLADVEGMRVASLGVMGHSFGGSTATYVAAVDDRCEFVCASGSLCSFAKRQEEGTGINMFEVVPGIATMLDAHDLVASISPRHQFYISATSDPYSLDADDVIARSGTDGVKHLRVDGSHALDQHRFDAMVGWAAGSAGR